MNSTFFYQLFESESSTYTYLIGDSVTKEAAIIDPVLETVDRDLKLISELGVKLKYILDTHVHADHITGAAVLKGHTGAKTALSVESSVDCVDLLLKDNEILTLGDKKIRAIATPGHTHSCMSFYFEGCVFTGDALLIRGTGRTDFQQGSSEKLFHSIREKLFELPDETKVYPGHDYRGQTASTIGLEKKYNPRLSLDKSLEDFVKTMSELKLANPKKIDVSVPANLKCGKQISSRVLHPQMVDGIPEVTAEEVFSQCGKVRMIDVRGSDEFVGELGHVEGAELKVLGDELVDFLKAGDRNQELVFICRSGGRSGRATLAAMELGYKNIANMAGGMLRWNDLKLPTSK